MIPALRSTLLGTIGALLACHASAGPVLDEIRARGNIVVAHRESSVPFSYVDESGKAVGYAVDLCRRVAEACGASST